MPLSHLSTKPTVQVSWPQLLLTIPYSVAVSELCVVPKVKVVGTNIEVRAAYAYTGKPQTTNFTFNLPKLGMKKEAASSATAFWLNPDGTRQPLSVQIAPPTNK